jgi:uridine kinase
MTVSKSPELRSGADKRDELLEQLASHVLRGRPRGPARVAVDGVDCAGKSTLADELGVKLRGYGRPVVRASLDDFHNPRRFRRRSGDTPRAYYEDSFDYDTLRRVLLEPLRVGGTREYRTRVFDYQNDRIVAMPALQAPEKAVLVFDGVFLLRPALADWWDYSIYVHVPFEVAVERAVRRDAEQFGGAAKTEIRYRQKYIPGQLLYLEECRPHVAADVVVDNSDPTLPTVIAVEDRKAALGQALAFSP